MARWACVITSPTALSMNLSDLRPIEQEVDDGHERQATVRERLQTFEGTAPRISSAATSGGLGRCQGIPRWAARAFPARTATLQLSALGVAHGY